MKRVRRIIYIDYENAPNILLSPEEKINELNKIVSEQDVKILINLERN